MDYIRIDVIGILLALVALVLNKPHDGGMAVT